jgi:hypothetical protein
MFLGRCLLLNVLVISLIFAASCENRDRLIGSYEGYAEKSQRPLKAKLELGADGQGSWSMENNTVPFKWEIRGSEIWLHTKDGGVIAGKFSGNAIEINLPGMGDCHLKKSAK